MLDIRCYYGGEVCACRGGRKNNSNNDKADNNYTDIKHADNIHASCKYIRKIDK